jgi:hypothetical protein
MKFRGPKALGDIHGNPGHVYATHDYWVTAFAPFGGGGGDPAVAGELVRGVASSLD